jgi:hypothetical protein
LLSERSPSSGLEVAFALILNTSLRFWPHVLSIRREIQNEATNRGRQAHPRNRCGKAAGRAEGQPWKFSACWRSISGGGGSNCPAVREMLTMADENPTSPTPEPSVPKSPEGGDVAAPKVSAKKREKSSKGQYVDLPIAASPWATASYSVAAVTSTVCETPSMSWIVTRQDRTDM